VWLVTISEHGIFYDIDTNTNKNSIDNKGIFLLVYNRVGVSAFLPTVARGPELGKYRLTARLRDTRRLG